MLARAAWIVCLGLLLPPAVATTWADTIQIEFDQLESLARTQSPGSRLIELEYDRTQAEKDESLKWSNPELAYDREDVEVAAEHQITFGKRFELPWVNLKKRSSWRDRLSSASLAREEGMNLHLADLKAGYVAVRVDQQYLLHLQELREMIDKAASVVESRHSEGHLSGIEARLIRMVVVSLNASHQSALQQQRERFAHWRAALGIAAADSIILSTEIGYHDIELQSGDFFAARVESQPGFLARQVLQQAWSKQASAERAGFIPAVEVYGGLKQIDPDLDGYVAGVSLTLPLFNQNGATARKSEVESARASQEAQLYREQTIGKVRALVASISESQQMLGTFTGQFEANREALESLLYSYEEGWLSLTELLNAIQIETNGLGDYYEQLSRYYENLFELEALTGESLVRF